MCKAGGQGKTPRFSRKPQHLRAVHKLCNAIWGGRGLSMVHKDQDKEALKRGKKGV